MTIFRYNLDAFIDLNNIYTTTAVFKLRHRNRDIGKLEFQLLYRPLVLRFSVPMQMHLPSDNIELFNKIRSTI